jgi:surface antigen
LHPPAARNALSHSLYKAWGRVGLLAIGHRGTALTLILIGLGTGGCSFSRNDSGGPFAMMQDSEVTGSVHASAPTPTETDLAFARTAASDVLTKGEKDASQPWENPETGARGSVTPLAQAYSSEDGRTCRDFLASYVNGKTESWLQGAACQSGHGRWEVHSLKPWRQG